MFKLVLAIRLLRLLPPNWVATTSWYSLTVLSLHVVATAIDSEVVFVLKYRLRGILKTGLLLNLTWHQHASISAIAGFSGTFARLS